MREGNPFSCFLLQENHEDEREFPVDRCKHQRSSSEFLAQNQGFEKKKHVFVKQSFECQASRERGINSEGIWGKPGDRNARKTSLMKLLPNCLD